MSQSIFTYDVPSTFLSGLDTAHLQQTIEQSSIGVTFYMVRYGDYLDIIFSSPLDGTQQTTLANIIATHDGTPIYSQGSDYGSMYVPNNEDLDKNFTMRVSTSFEPLSTGTNIIAGNLNNFTFTPASGSDGPYLTVGATGSYKVDYNITFSISSNTSNGIFAVAVNNSIQNNTIISKDTSKKILTSISLSNILSLNGGDNIELQTKILSGSSTISLYNVYLNLVRIKDSD